MFTPYTQHTNTHASLSVAKGGNMILDSGLSTISKASLAMKFVL
jgi:hypothetical protein